MAAEQISGIQELNSESLDLYTLRSFHFLWILCVNGVNK